MDQDALSALRIDRDRAARDAERRARPWLWLTALSVIALAVAAWIVLAPDAEPAANAAPARVAPDPTPATTAAPASSAPTVLNASGYVVARRVATVASKVTGQIVDVRIEEGMSVDAGDVLATLDDTTARAELALAESRLETARRQAAEFRVRLDESERTRMRLEDLRGRALASEAELDAATADVAALRARLAVVESEVASATNAVALSRRGVDDTVIRAPFAGVVVSKNAQPGETISPMSSGGFTRTGIATIVDMSSLEIEVDVNEAYINRVEPGQHVEAVLDAYPDWRIPGSVTSIVPTADRQKATVKVRIGFDELDPRILPEMGVQVWFREGRG